MFAKDFLKDRRILLLGFLTSFLAVANIFSVVIQTDLNQSQVTFRHWLVNGHSQFYPADASYFYTFIAAALLVGLSSWIISYRLYDSFRPAAYFSFLLGQIVLLANFLVVQSLLAL